MIIFRKYANVIHTLTILIFEPNLNWPENAIILFEAKKWKIAKELRQDHL